MVSDQDYRGTSRRLAVAAPYRRGKPGRSQRAADRLGESAGDTHAAADSHLWRRGCGGHTRVEGRLDAGDEPLHLGGRNPQGRSEGAERRLGDPLFELGEHALLPGQRVIDNCHRVETKLQRRRASPHRRVCGIEAEQNRHVDESPARARGHACSPQALGRCPPASALCRRRPGQTGCRRRGAASAASREPAAQTGRGSSGRGVSSSGSAEPSLAASAWLSAGAAPSSSPAKRRASASSISSLTGSSPRASA